MLLTALKIIIVALTITVVSEVAGKFPRLGALLLSIPTVSVAVFVLVWFKERDLKTIAELARHSLILIPLTLPFYFAVGFSQRLHLSFWVAMTIGVVVSGLLILPYLYFSGKT